MYERTALSGFTMRNAATFVEVYVCVEGEDVEGEDVGGLGLVRKWSSSAGRYW